MRWEDVLRDPGARAAVPAVEDLTFVRGRSTTIECVQAACATWAARPCLDEVRFAEVWERVVALASAWAAADLVRPGDTVCLCGHTGIDWVVADLACLYRGAVSVPLQMTLPRDDLRAIIAQLQPRLIFAAADCAKLAAELATTAAFARLDERPAPAAVVAPTPAIGDALATVMYTSGSTGTPKGVMYPASLWQRYLTGGPRAPLPLITVGYLPLCHLMGRTSVYTTLLHGGTTHFSANADRLFDDIRAARPTQLQLVPRISAMIYKHFQAQLVARGADAAEQIAGEMRTRFLGDRLCLITASAAPTPPAIVAFLARCFDVEVINGYAAAEIGLVAVNERVVPGVEYQLIDVPELGYTTRDKPYPRGELAVRSPLRAAGYFGEARRAPDELVRSGDIVEEIGERRIRVIDRRNSIIKLAHGEFVSTARIEDAILAASAYVAQIYVHGDSSRAYLLAVIVPTPLAGDDARAVLRRELDRIAADGHLAPHEVPRDFVIATEPFTVDNRMLTESNKPRRPAIVARYGDTLAALYDAIDGRGATPSTDAVHDPVVGAIARVAGRVPAEIDASPGATFRSLGGDSLTAVELVELLAASGIHVPIAAVLSATTTIAQLRELATRGGTRDVDDLRLERFVAVREIVPSDAAPSTVLVTGANGFLGRAIVEALRARSMRVVCVVRAANDASAAARGPRDVEVIAGDVSRAHLGWSDARYRDIAERVDTIVHAGALVNHSLTYEQLFDTNFLGTAHVAQLALDAAASIQLVSSTSVASGRRYAHPVLESQTASALWQRRPAYAGPELGGGYAASKWAAERIVEDLHARCGVAVNVFRCSMVLPHRTRDDANPSDWWTLLLSAIVRSGVAPASFYAQRPAHFDGVPVDIVAEAIAALASQPARGHRIFHASNDHVDAAVSLDTIVDWLRSAGRSIERVPHADWFARCLAAVPAAAHGVFRRWERPLPDGAEPLFDTRELRAQLSSLGAQAMPVLDEAYIHHCLRAIL